MWDAKTRSVLVDGETILKMHAEVYKQTAPAKNSSDSAEMELLTVFKEENEHLKAKMHDMNKQLSFE